jgi:hypothetical protein
VWLVAVTTSFVGREALSLTAHSAQLLYIGVLPAVLARPRQFSSSAGVDFGSTMAGKGRADKADLASKLGTFSGVFVPTTLYTFSILMFLRFGFILGQTGLIGFMGEFTTCIVTMSLWRCIG